MSSATSRALLEAAIALLLLSLDACVPSSTLAEGGSGAAGAAGLSGGASTPSAGRGGAGEGQSLGGSGGNIAASGASIGGAAGGALCGGERCGGVCEGDRCVGDVFVYLPVEPAHPMSFPTLLLAAGGFLYVPTDAPASNILVRLSLSTTSESSFTEVAGRSVAMGLMGNTLLVLSETAPLYREPQAPGLHVCEEPFGTAPPGLIPSPLLAAVRSPGGVAATASRAFVTGREAPDNQWGLLSLSPGGSLELVEGTTSQLPLGKVSIEGDTVLYSSPWRGDVIAYHLTTATLPRVVIDGASIEQRNPTDGHEHPFRGMFATSAQKVYAWTQGEIVRSAIDGGSPTEHVASVDGDVGDLLADERFVYWTELVSKRLRASPIAGGPALTLAEGLDTPGSLAIANGSIYWPERRKAAIMRVALP